VSLTILTTGDSGAVRRSLQRLRDAGVLRQTGQAGEVTYTLVESIAPLAAFRPDPRRLEDRVTDAAARGPVSNEAVRSLTGLNRAQAGSLLKALVEAGRLRNTGSRRGTPYEAI